jgi:plastocyanin
MYYLQAITSSLAATSAGWGRREVSWNSSTSPALGPSASVAATTSQQVVEIVVGAAGRLIFNPDSVSVTAGTTLRFNFLSLNHTLTQSSFSHPCSHEEQFDTGFQQFNPLNVSGKFLVDFPVLSEEPQWFYCAQSIPRSHCQAGMVFSLNPGDRYEEFIHNAIGTQTTAVITTKVNSCPRPTVASGRPAGTGNGTGSGGLTGPAATSITPEITNLGRQLAYGPAQLLGGVAMAFAI